MTSAGKVVFIVAGGEPADPSLLREKVSALSPAVICADGGARSCRAAGLVPDLIVGDMDSLDAGTEAYYRSQGSRVVRHPGHKDETDTELALREAFAMDAGEVWIWGGLGGRVDHLLANVSLLLQGVEQGIPVKLIDRWCEIFPVSGRRVIEGETGQTVSVLPFAGEATGITLTGFEYPLTKADMAAGHPYGVSNRLAGPRGIIEVGAGCLLVVRYFRPGVFPGEERG